MKQQCDELTLQWAPSRRFLDALTLATVLHGNQGRKGTSIPYLGHLLAVCSMVIDHNGTEDEAIAALLHDAPEDQGGKETLSKIQAQFGKVVSGIVEHCSDTFAIPKPPWRPRKEAYLASLAACEDRSVHLVSAADKLHNARCTLNDYLDLGEQLWKRFSANRTDTLWYYTSLIKKYDSGPCDSRRAPIVRELKAIIDAIEAVSPPIPSEDCAGGDRTETSGRLSHAVESKTSALTLHSATLKDRGLCSDITVP